MIELLLFWRFFVIGLFCYGGGYAILPLLQAASLRYGWLTQAEFIDMIALAQMTPGPIGINLATFAGYKIGGVGGALAASVGVMMPGIIITLLVTVFFMKFRETRFMKSVFYGLRPTVTGLLAFALLSIAVAAWLPDWNAAGGASWWSCLSWRALLISAVSLALLFRKIGTIPLIILAVLAGIIFM